MQRREISFGWTLAAAGLLALATACSGDDEGMDAGPRDAGASDSGATVPDSGTGEPDAGFVDAGPPRDGGHYCATNDEVDVNGTSVPVDPATTEPEGPGGLTASLTCIDDPPDPSPFPQQYCITECLDFMGYQPTEDEVRALEFALFRATDANGAPVDPSFDYDTYQDRSPGAARNFGFQVARNAMNCDSGWQVELGYNDLVPNPGAAQSFAIDEVFTVRVRTASTATQDASWPTMYYTNFVRRADETAANCGNEQRSPSNNFRWLVVPPTLVDAAVAEAGNVPGSDDLLDGRGQGYALVEVRDCATGSGGTIAHATGGFVPAPAGTFYLDDTYGLAPDAMETDVFGTFMGVGLGDNTATSSDTADITAAVGLTTDGTCTEEYGGSTMPVYPDSVTFQRFNRETVIHE